MHLHRSIVVLAFMVVAAPSVSSVSAQTSPSWGLTLSVGEGPHTRQAGDVYFLDDAVGNSRIAVFGRLTPARRAWVVVQGELVPGKIGDRLSICYLAPNGSCREYFPNQDGIGASVGVGTRASAFTGMLLLGGGSYAQHARTFADLDLGFSVSRHFSLTATSRQMTWVEPQYGRLWYRPILIGLRFQN